MAKKQDDRDSAIDTEPKEVPVVVDERGAEEKLATAIESMVAANQPKSMPMHGPTPTDAEGKPLEVHGKYVERDGKEYDAIIDGNPYLSDRAWVKGGEDPLSGKAATFGHAVAFNLRVNFKAKKSDNWKPVHGVYMLQDMRNTHKKQYLVLPPEMASHFTLQMDSRGKVATLPSGVVRK